MTAILRRRLLSALGLPVGAAMALTLATAMPSDAQEQIRWRVPVAFGTNLPALGDQILYVAEQVNAVSGGQVQMRPFEPGTLVPALAITEAARDRKIDVGYTWLGYDQGRIPASALFAAVPFGMEPWEFTAWWYEAGGKELAEEIYGAHGVHPVFCGIIGPEAAGWFRNEITSLDDVKGLKIRFAGIGGKVMQKLGASVTLLPGGEIFQALERGAIDATEFSMPAIDDRLGFYRVVKYNYFPGWHQTFTAFHLAVNKQTWDGLSDQTRALIDVVCTASVTRNLAHGEAIQGDVIRDFEENKGVNVRSLPEDLLRELQSVTAEVMAEEAKADANFAKVYASQQEFVERYRPWKTLGYLPRDF